MKNLTDNIIVILIISLAIGLSFPKQAIVFAPYVTLLLAIIFFLTALKIDFKEILYSLKDKKMLLVANLFMLIILPIIIYYLTILIYPPLAVAFLILAAMPAGMTAPLLAEICGGRHGMTLVLAITTSLLAPFTIPLIFKFLIGAEVKTYFWSIFFSLFKIIFIPFVLAYLIKHFWEKKIKKTFSAFKPISTVLLAFLIMGIVAKQADQIRNNINLDLLIYLIALFVLFIVLHFLGFFTIFWRHKKDRIAITVSLTYMNITLALYIASEFFADPSVLLPIILAALPWVLLVIPFKYLMKGMGMTKVSLWERIFKLY